MYRRKHPIFRKNSFESGYGLSLATVATNIYWVRPRNGFAPRKNRSSSQAEAFSTLNHRKPFPSLLDPREFLCARPKPVRGHSLTTIRRRSERWALRAHLERIS